MLGSCDRSLAEAYDLAMLDLDGVVYVSGRAVPGAPGHLERARAAGLRLAFVTNNASRTPERVAEHLRDLGVEAQSSDVVTSAQAAARVLRDRLPPGASVVLLGAAGLEQAVRAEGLRPVPVTESDGAAALVTGYGPNLTWRDIMRAAVLVREGLWWVASNTDLTIPTDYGVAPGHGVLVDMLRRFSGVEPVVAGKPATPLLEETVRRVGGQRPLMVGDRLDTDIEGGRAAGFDTLLVLTGVTGLAELVAADPGQRPRYLSVDLGGLLTPTAAPDVGDDDGVELGGWRVTVGPASSGGSGGSGGLEVSGSGGPDDWWRSVAVAAWRHRDRTGEIPDVDSLEPPAPAPGARR